MTTARHVVIESPVGELTVVADGDALTGVYFPQHWHPPTADALGGRVEPAADELFGSCRGSIARIPDRGTDAVRSAFRLGG